MTTLIPIAVGVTLALLFLIFYLAFLSRHKKSATGKLELIGKRGVVHSALDPEGTVIVAGELWPARAADGELLEVGAGVRVMSFDGPIVVVTGTK